MSGQHIAPAEFEGLTRWRIDHNGAHKDPTGIWLMEQDAATAMTAQQAEIERLRAVAEQLAGGIQCLLAICGTPIGRRRLNLDPSDERLTEATTALAAHAKLKGDV